MHQFIAFFIFLFAYLFPFYSFSLSPEETIYLTWQQKPDTTMTIQWLSLGSDKNPAVFFRLEGEDQWKQQTGKCDLLPYSTNYFIHTVELINLQPAKNYQFKINQVQPIYTFHTMPTHLNSSILFVEGGDMFHDELFYVATTCKEAAKQAPDFALLGGDLAYALGSPKDKFDNIERWIQWIKNWHATMVTPQGHLIPVVSAIGNHDIIGHFNQTPKQAQVFKALFPSFDSPLYRTLDFGSYLSLFILDSGHAHAIAGEQAAWLKKQLAMRSHVTHRLAAYHVPAFPTVRSFYNKQSKAIRQFWLPLFEEGKIHLAFEHHDHAYKRTYALLKGKIHPQGTIFLGDGGWGVKHMRQPKQRRLSRALMAKTASKKHFILVRLTNEEQLIQTITDDGQILDQYTHQVKKKS